MIIYLSNPGLKPDWRRCFAFVIYFGAARCWRLSGLRRSFQVLRFSSSSVCSEVASSVDLGLPGACLERRFVSLRSRFHGWALALRCLARPVGSCGGYRKKRGCWVAASYPGDLWQPKYCIVLWAHRMLSARVWLYSRPTPADFDSHPDFAQAQGSSPWF